MSFAVPYFTNLSMSTTQNILLVEDNDADREDIHIMLREAKHKYTLYDAQSLSEAYLQLKELSVDLVLLDLGLPDSTGFQTLLRYLDKSSNVPVVVMTGFNKQQLGTKAVRAGAQDYLVKGEFRGGQLIKSIRYALERFRHQAAAEQLADAYSTEGDRLRELYRMASLGDWEMDVVTTSMTWSDELFHIMELTPHSFSPTLSDYLQYVHREDRTQVEQFITEAMEQESSGPIEHRILVNNRQVKHLSVRTKLRFDEKSNQVLLIGSVQNITRKEIEPQPVIRAEGEPVAEQKELTLDPNNILNQISFNIRTPLSTIINLLYLFEQTQLSNQQAKHLADLKTAFDDLSFTLSNLVNLSILSNDDLPLAKEYYRPQDLLESIQRVMSFKAQQNNRELDMYIDSHLSFMVQGDSNVLGQLFFCLTELAFLHSIEEAFLKLRCTKAETKAKQVCLVVQLEYSGLMPKLPEDIEDLTTINPVQILQPQSLSNNREYLLSIVFLRLCKQLNVSYKLNAQKGGVYMDLEIPLVLKDKTSDYPAEPQQELKVLLVEDHPMHQIATKQILSNWSDKVTVTVANNGKVALNKLKDNEYHIILMDLQMPEMDGMTAVAQIRQTSAIPIIALTASTSKQEEERCYDIGMNDYLAKPFQAVDLQRRIIKLTH